MSTAIDRSETQELIIDFRHGAPAKPPIVESGQHRTTVLNAKSCRLAAIFALPCLFISG